MTHLQFDRVADLPQLPPELIRFTSLLVLACYTHLQRIPYHATCSGALCTALQPNISHCPKPIMDWYDYYSDTRSENADEQWLQGFYS
jgi:hypothetical protein